MKRPLMAAVLLLLMLTACSTETQTVAEPVADPMETVVQTEAETAEQAETEPATAPPPAETAPPAAEPQYTGEPHIFDECGVLDEDTVSHYNAYLDNLSGSRQISAAVVITDSLEGASPESYAKARYQALYGEESGFLVLINNDTLQDVVYRSGVCSTYITDTAIPIAQATPHLVTCDYAGALDILLPLGELVPEQILDRSGSLKDEQVQALLEMAKESPEAAVLLTKNTPQPEEGQTPEEALAASAEEIRSRLGAQRLLVMDVQQKRCVIAGDPPELLASEVQGVWTAQGIQAAVTHYYAGLNPLETAIEEDSDTEETT